MQEIYFNLHKKCLSIRENGLVVQHTTTAFLTDVTFKVSQAGRERVLREKAKNVHAFIVGTVTETSDWEHLDIDKPVATYNPYKYTSFVMKHDQSPIFKAKRVLITGRVIYILEA